MNYYEFEILRMIDEDGNINPASLSRQLYLDLDSVNQSLLNLNRDGYLRDDHLTEKAIKELEDHRITSALILAAGTSSRFVPLNFETPKGLLSAKGEKLIERQIRQLQEKGINKIGIVVGYQKEKFNYLVDKFGVELIESTEYKSRNNHSSIYAARDFLDNTIVTSSDLYFSKNIFQKYAYDSYYTSIFIPGKTAERGIFTDNEGKIIETFYGDKAFDTWVTLGYAFFSKEFSNKIIDYIAKDYNLNSIRDKFWADIQDEHINDLFMYAKKCDFDDIHEFDSLEELRQFDMKYLTDSGSSILKKICKLLGVKENEIIGIETLNRIKSTLFKFRSRGEVYICDVNPVTESHIVIDGRSYYQCRDFEDPTLKLYKMDKSVGINESGKVNIENELDRLYSNSKDFKEYHDEALPLCAAENVISPFANLPLSYGFQERYIMNNTYSFNMDDNFIGCEMLFPFYQSISDVCERLFSAKYTDCRPFTGMHCIDMIAKTVCDFGDKIMILGKEAGGHASVRPVLERLGLEVIDAPYDYDNNDVDYEKANKFIKEQSIGYILLAPSDLIKPLDVKKIDTDQCVLLYDFSQVMGLIAAGLVENPLKSIENMIMFGGTHKTFPGPASGLILTNSKKLHDRMEMNINPKYTRHSQMHQKICLLFALTEFEKFGADYMSHMVHSSNYLGNKLRLKGLNVASQDGLTSKTHEIFIFTDQDLMNTIYDNAFKAKVTLNKKHKKLFNGYGIRLGTQEIARYNWDDNALDTIADIVEQLTKKDMDVEYVRNLINTLPPKKVHYTFSDDIVNHFRELMHD